MVWSNYGKVLGLYFSIRIVCMNLTSFSIKKGRKKKRAHISVTTLTHLYIHFIIPAFSSFQVWFGLHPLYFSTGLYIYFMEHVEYICLFACISFFVIKVRRDLVYKELYSQKRSTVRKNASRFSLALESFKNNSFCFQYSPAHLIYTCLSNYMFLSNYIFCSQRFTSIFLFTKLFL